MRTKWASKIAFKSDVKVASGPFMLKSVLDLISKEIITEAI